MKPLSISLVLLCLISCIAGRNSENSATLPSPTFKQIYPIALRGELHKVFNILDTIHKKELTKQEQELYEKYYARFIHQSGIYAYKTKDPVIIEFVEKFHTYWKSSMMNTLDSHTADSLFIQKNGLLPIQ